MILMHCERETLYAVGLQMPIKMWRKRASNKRISMKELTPHKNGVQAETGDKLPNVVFQKKEEKK